MLSYPKKIIVLTGAGVSKESGLDTFRGTDGVYTRVNIEDVATPEAFARNPMKVHSFYNARRAGLLNANVSPNAAHEALARLERECRDAEFLLVTQNVDNLHERAGSRNIVHVHGEILKARCNGCGQVTGWEEPIDLESKCPKCNTVGKMRVHVVWFGEMPFGVDRICEELKSCDLFVSVGTSGTVYPAAGFVRIAGDAGARTVELNLEPSQGQSMFDEKVYGQASEVVPQFVDRILEGNWHVGWE